MALGWPELGEMPLLGFLNKQPELWGETDVQTWLGSVGMTSYGPEFEGINGKELLGLENENLEDMGVYRESHREYFLKLITCLAQSSFFFDCAFTEPTWADEESQSSDLPHDDRTCRTELDVEEEEEHKKTALEEEEVEEEEVEEEEEEEEKEEEKDQKEEGNEIGFLCRKKGEQNYLSLSSGASIEDFRGKLANMYGPNHVAGFQSARGKFVSVVNQEECEEMMDLGRFRSDPMVLTVKAKKNKKEKKGKKGKKGKKEKKGKEKESGTVGDSPTTSDPGFLSRRSEKKKKKITLNLLPKTRSQPSIL